MKINIKFLALCFYIIPAASSVQVLSFFDRDLDRYASETICISLVSAIVGYVTANFCFSKEINYMFNFPKYFYKRTACVLIVFGILALSLNFIRIGSFPLFSGDHLRGEMQKTVLWNIMVFCSVGIFLLSSTIRRYPHLRSKAVTLLTLFFLMLVFLTGWKGTFLNFLFLALIPYFKNIKLKLSKLAMIFSLFLLLFVVVNFLRNGGQALSLISLVFYIYWGFKNFSDFGNEIYTGFYSVPLLAKRFSIDNSLLTDPTWNVYSALMPLYIDGGKVLVAIVFFLIPFTLVWSSKRHNSLSIDFIFYLCFTFLFIAHNSYLFTSKNHVLMFFFIFMLELLGANRNTLFRRKFDKPLSE